VILPVSAIVVLLVVDLGKTDDLKARGGRRVTGRGGLLHHYLGPDPIDPRARAPTLNPKVEGSNPSRPIRLAKPFLGLSLGDSGESRTLGIPLPLRLLECALTQTIDPG
jgi:hypothetical protein